MADKAPNIVQRFLYGPKGKDISTALTVVEEKGAMFPIDRANNYSWSTPTYPINTSGYFGGTHDYKIDAGDLVDSSVVMA